MLGTALGVLVGYLVLAAIAGDGDPRKCFAGADGRSSTSKFQFFVWTGAVVFAYVAVALARASRGNHEVLSDIPPHLLTVMGFSAATLASAKGALGRLALSCPSMSSVFDKAGGICALEPRLGRYP